MEDLGREQGINFTRKKVIEQYSGFPEGKRLSYTKANISKSLCLRTFDINVVSISKILHQLINR